MRPSRLLRRVASWGGWSSTTRPNTRAGSEIEIGVLKRQCLDRRIDTRDALEREIAAWERNQNTAGARVKGMFTTEQARVKMGRAYPKPTATLKQPAKES
jgi:hypothetical protein